MKINKIYLAFCVAGIALFFAGRCTAPKPELVANKHTIDSLTISARTSHNRALMAEDRAQKAFQKGMKSQKAKVIIRTFYRQEVAKTRKFSASKKDSLIKEMFKVPYSDSSRFTEPVTNGILDLGSENHMLKSNAVLDSMTMVAKDEGIQELGYALNELTAEGEAKNGLVIEERETNKKLRKEVRKQKRLKWVAIGGVFVIGTLSIISN